MKKKKTPLKIKSAEESSLFVSLVATKVRREILKEISVYEEDAHWLLMGRIVNSLFSSFYMPAINFAETQRLEAAYKLAEKKAKRK